jgi:predicted heme/steroid binding protein
MDYLDPKKKRARKNRLIVGYGLIAIAIAIATVLLVYIANGFYIDRNTGEVIQNGLVYLDSRPGGADVLINGEKQRTKTDARLVIPSGQYTFELKKDGYRSWQRTIQLEGGSLRQLTYAKLIPNQLETAPSLDLRSNPTAISQSINKRWLITSFADSPLSLTLTDLEQSPLTSIPLEIPPTLVSESTTGQIEIVDWADDNRHFLATYTVGDTVSYISVDRENPSLAQNLNTLFGNSAYEIGMRDRKFDQFFVYNPSVKSITTASISGGVSTDIFVENVIDFKTFGTDWVLYVTESGEEGLVDVRFKRGDKNILIKQIKTSDNYLLQLAKLGNAPVMGFSSPVENRAVIYNDPEAYLNDNPDVKMPIATTVLRVNSPIDLRISADSSVILAYGPENYASHEFEADRSYNFEVGLPVDVSQEIAWLDGQHFLFSSAGKQHMIDFDGSNQYELVESIPTLGSIYSEDLSLMFSFTPSAVGINGQPNIPARINLTNLLVEADR